jgi:hypothetical protein
MSRRSRELFGEEDLERLIRETECLRHSTTSGTNVVVEHSWETPEPPREVPFYSSWKDRSLLYRGSSDDTYPADATRPVMTPNPKDVRIVQLEARIAAPRARQG